VQHNRLVVIAVLGALLMGCYTLQPIGGVTPPLGSQVAFDITDAGRVALGGTMGPEIDLVEGRLLEATNGDYVVSVSGVKLIGGGHQPWAGERVSISKEHVSRTYERRFSKGRTLVFAGVVVAGAVVLAGGSAGIFDPGSDPPGGDTLITLKPRLRPVRP
jgi:hypothetical protein